jgi:predicted NBD/HSP70 family sugar kinase
MTPEEYARVLYAPTLEAYGGLGLDAPTLDDLDDLGDEDPAARACVEAWTGAARIALGDMAAVTAERDRLAAGLADSEQARKVYFDGMAEAARQRYELRALIDAQQPALASSLLATRAELAQVLADAGVLIAAYTARFPPVEPPEVREAFGRLLKAWEAQS